MADFLKAIHEILCTVSLTNFTRVMKSNGIRWVGHVARTWESRNAYRIMLRNRKGKRPFGRPKRRWGDNIKVGLKAVGWMGGCELD
jgi:hypothetical protein